LSIYQAVQTAKFEVKVNCMLESKHQPLAPFSVFRRRILKSFLFGMFILFISLMIGIVGYHFTGNIPWIDSLHNAAMILSGMGPVVEIKSVSGKIFSTFYALFSGVIFITNIGVILAPAIHRFFHQLHVQAPANDRA
jgi:Co/Zn/Cd efflux system component